MRHNEPEGDIIPEDIAIRRGMQYEVRIAKVNGEDTRIVTHAHQPHPFLIDRLYDRRVIGHDHHFYGVQFITMRKLFLRDVSVKVGMLRVKSEEGAAEEKPIPMEDNDYLQVIRRMRNNRWKEIVLGVCDESSDPLLADRYGRMQHEVGMAFDQLCDAVKALWEEKRQAAEGEPDDRFR